MKDELSAVGSCAIACVLILWILYTLGVGFGTIQALTR